MIKFKFYPLYGEKMFKFSGRIRIFYMIDSVLKVS